MGRCYEFGVAVHEGCEHAMVVGPDRGLCHCTSCGTECRGKFAGCVAVTSQPGYVPLLAPDWAVSRAPSEAAAMPAPPPKPAGPPPSSDVAVQLEEGPRPAPELAAVVARLESSYRALAEQVRSVHDEQVNSREALERLHDDVLLLVDELGRGGLPRLRWRMANRGEPEAPPPR